MHCQVSDARISPNRGFSLKMTTQGGIRRGLISSPGISHSNCFEPWRGSCTGRTHLSFEATPPFDLHGRSIQFSYRPYQLAPKKIFIHHESADVITYKDGSRTGINSPEMVSCLGQISMKYGTVTLSH